MKINKSILAVMLALGITGIASADDVYVSGSTAMRSVIYNALIATNCVFTNSATYAGDGSSGTASKETYMNFTGTLVGNGSTVTTIHCSWSGSEAGILNVASNGVSQAYFMPNTVTGDTTSNTNSIALANVDLCLADNAQSFSRTKTPTLTGTKIGVITFEWVRNNGLWSAGSSSGLTNLTDSAIQAALSGGCRLADFTGNAADTSFVYVMGRDNQSGTRVNAYGDCGYGIFTPPQQIEVDSSGNMINLGTSTGNGYTGDYGYSSGGTLAGQMGKNTTATTDQVNSVTGFSVIAYLGISDATTALGNAGTAALSYNGVPFSAAAVINGQYPFWGYEYVYKSPSASASGVVAYNRLAKLATLNTGYWTGIFDGVKAIHLTTMSATRGGPTSQPSF